MVSKVIAWGRDRDEAIKRMKRALNEFVIEGVKTTIPFHYKLMDNETFKSGKFNTKFLEINKDLF
jgi:acetyl-CoA carboxylase biotin carboxylase subunit